MKLTREQIQKINDTHKWIADWCPYLETYDYIEYLENEISEEDLSEITFHFPEDSEVSIETSEYLKLCEEIPSIEVVNMGYIKTPLRRYYIVEGSTSDEDYSYIVENYFNFEMQPLSGVKINLIQESFIVGLVAVHHEEFDKDSWRTVDQYSVLEIIYEDESKVLSEEKEKSLIDSYIFEIADTTGMALSFSKIWNPMPHFEDRRESFEDEVASSGLRDLEPSNEGMRLFVSATQIHDPELKFLNYYKVLEHFAPIAINIEANELMRKKLDAPKGAFEDGDYIRSIFKLANSMKAKYNDEDLIKACFNTCFDFIGLFEKLPLSLKKNIKKHLKIKELEYSAEKQLITTAINMAGKVIYKTRNGVVHAKSNYNLTGDEVSLREFRALNEFMKEASSQAIRWYSRQPSYLKLKIIE